MSVTIRQHQSLHISHGAHGKAIFAFLDDPARDRLLDTDQLFFHGEPEDLDRQRLSRELANCRTNGYAVDNGEVTPGITAVSAPVFNHKNSVTAAIVLVGTFTQDKFERLGRQTAAAARLISRKAGARLP